MGRFDGVALIACGPAGSHVADRARLQDAIDGCNTVTLPDGRLAAIERPLGVPGCLSVLTVDDTGDGRWGPAKTDDGVSEVVVRGLSSLPPHTPRGDHDDLASVVVAAGATRDHLAVLPPADVVDLVALTPLSGGRTHIGRRGDARTACGRLPLRGEPRPLGRVDCLRCLRASVVADRLDQQHHSYPALVALAGPVLAAAAAQLWRRLAHRDPGMHPELLDSMVGAIAYRLPGAPEPDDVLVLVRRHLDVVSPVIRRWAAAWALARLEAQVRRLAAQHPTRLSPAVEQDLALNGGLLDHGEAAEVLVAALEEDGPAPALEPLTLRVAVRAGDDASERVQRWRRRHRVATALGGGSPTSYRATATEGRRRVPA